MAYATGLTVGLYKTEGEPVAFSNEATTADATRKRYSITAQAKRYWDEDTPVVVEKDVGGGFIAVNAADYTVEHPGGVIVFAVALPVGASVRVDGAYYVYSEVAELTGYKMSAGYRFTDITKVRQRAKARMPGLFDWSLSFNVNRTTSATGGGDPGSVLFDLIGSKIGVVIHETGTFNLHDTSGARFEGFGYFSNDDMESKVEDVIKDVVTVLSHMHLYRRT